MLHLNVEVVSEVGAQLILSVDVDEEQNHSLKLLVLLGSLQLLFLNIRSDEGTERLNDGVQTSL